MPSSPSSSVIEARKALANRLIEIRKDAGLNGDELSAQCGWHPAKTSRIQSGISAPSESDIKTWCIVCGAVDQIADLIAAVRAVESMYTQWRRMERTGLRAAQESVAALYQRTGLFRVYASRVMPGMVQTREYTAAVLRSIQRDRVAIDDVDEAVDTRMERQHMLFSGRHRFGLLVEEYVLRAAVCDAETMAGQLGHLIAVSSRPFVSLGILPMGTGRPHLPVEDFYMFDEAEVAVELTSGYLRITQPREIADYVRTFTTLTGMAVHGAHARKLITAAIDALG
ncbi:helix-turn-helix domain-containing protein [Streptantibioticus ferralitis]|uniref:Helix-turn-helix transcriptional regulator n=1 Tax=Streptantibioticus ferralitis TaxID=236510 RepID=A0ABT5Z079_9ACTN|nr:helix-turn-helix transcriptional regulator [Streptantibioticus ferralitis]MDF2257189.1 helix-turn-helix transcriptional regulator [Streptantibioticus ferralitis]